MGGVELSYMSQAYEKIYQITGVDFI